MITDTAGTRSSDMPAYPTAAAAPPPECPGRPARTVTNSSHSQPLHDSTTPVKFEDPVILLALPLLATANTPAQRKLGRYWKWLHKMTYVVWGLLVIHLLLLDGVTPFGASDGDGDPIFHQRFYQAVAISVPLVILRLPPVRRWITEQRAAGRHRQVWLAVMPLAALYIVGMAFLTNEEIFTGTKVITMHPLAN